METLKVDNPLGDRDKPRGSEIFLEEINEPTKLMLKFL